jgi:hypothetical protein
MSSMQDIAQIQNRVTDAQRARARAEGARDAAQADYEAALAELETTYQIESVEEAVHLLARLRTELDQLARDITAKLDEIGIA